MNLILVESEECVVDENDNLLVDIPFKDRRGVHMQTILKLESGDTVRAGIIGGKMYDAEVTSVESSFKLKMDPSKQRMYNKECDEDISIMLAYPRPRVLGRMYPIFSQQGVKNIAICSANRVEKC